MYNVYVTRRFKHQAVCGRRCTTPQGQQASCETRRCVTCFKSTCPFNSPTLVKYSCIDCMIGTKIQLHKLESDYFFICQCCDRNKFYRYRQHKRSLFLDTYAFENRIPLPRIYCVKMHKHMCKNLYGFTPIFCPGQLPVLPHIQLVSHQLSTFFPFGHASTTDVQRQQDHAL